MKLELKTKLPWQRKTEKNQFLDLKFKTQPLIASLQGELLEKYTIDQTTIFIIDQEGKGLYLINEPKMNPEEQQAYSLLMENLFFTLKPIDKTDNPLKYIEGFMWDAAEELGIVETMKKSFQKIRYFLSRDAFGYGAIHCPMNDPNIEEISCTGHGKPINTIHRKFSEYDWLETNITFPNEETLKNYVQKLAQRTGKSITTAIPFTDAMSKEGHRLAVTFTNEVTLPGSTFCIRKFPKSPLSMAYLLKHQTLTPLMAAYLWLLIEYKSYIMSLGPMGSGKTSLLSCLLTLIDPTLKIATIEDTPEIRIPHLGWQRFKTRHTYNITESRYDIDLLDLVKLSLRYRPDYIVVGEIRGQEIKALTQAAALGHGALCTLHAESPQAATVRMQSPPMNVTQGGLMLVGCFVQLNRIRTPTGKIARRILETTEIENKQSKPTLKQLFRWHPKTDTFTPQNPQEIAKSSIKLKIISKLTGWSNNELSQELSLRANYLQNIIDQNKLDYTFFSEQIRKFYVNNHRRKNQ